jgi:hypothetical protein
VFGAGQALISAFVGAAKALELPFPLNLAAYAKVLATGFSAVSAIQGVSAGGSTSGSRGVGGGGFNPSRSSSTQSAPLPPARVVIEPLDPNSIFTGKQLQNLFDDLLKEFGDRGIKPVFQ